MSKKQEVKPEVPFVTIPQVPQDFDGAIAVNREAKRAITYWTEEKTYARFEADKSKARVMVSRWKVVEQEAEAVIKTYQPSLF